MNYSDAENILLEIIKHDCAQNAIPYDELKLDSNLNLLETGLYDSLGFLQLIATIEETASIELDLSEEDPEEFTKFGVLVRLISESPKI